ncbi:MAG: DNA internalization-related competence protein ComEC/Rec2 [Pseudomonadota bacterium]
MKHSDDHLLDRRARVPRWLLLAWPLGVLCGWLLPWPSGRVSAGPWLELAGLPAQLVAAMPTVATWASWLCLPLVWLVWRRTSDMAAVGLAFLAGVAFALAAAGSLVAETPGFSQRVDCEVEGTVRGLADEQPDRSRFLLSVALARASDPASALSQRVCASLPRGGHLRLSHYAGEEDRDPVRSGYRYRLTARLKPLHEMANPGGFDYRRWLFRHRVLATGYLRDEPTSLGPSSGPVATVDRLRAVSRARLRATLEQIAEMPSGQGGRVAEGLLPGLAIGDRSGLEDRQWEILLATGTNHLLAISGLHVGMVALLAGGLLRFLWPRLRPRSAVPAQRVAAGAAVVAAWGYALLAGLSIPTLRAALMLSILLAGVLARRRWRLFDLWLLAVVAVLLVDPMAPLDMGFWLSFAAVLLILAAIRVRPTRVGAAGLLRLQWLLMLGLLPLTWALFDRVAFASLPANLVAVPLVSLLLTPLSLLVLAVSWLLGPGVAAWPAAGLGYLGHALFLLLEWLVDVFPDSVRASPPIPALLLFSVGMGWLLLPRGWPGKPLAALLVLPAVLWPTPRPAHGTFEALVMDVGQGEAVLLRTAEHDLLYDAGPRWGDFDTGEAVVLPTLRAFGVDRLERVVVSHTAGDHVGGLAAVRERYPDARIAGATQPGFGITADEAAGCAHGRNWTLDGVRFTLLQAPGGSSNDRSCLLRVSGDRESLLLTGDIEREAERWLVRNADVSADVVLVPHHGSATSSTLAFVEATGARTAVVSAGFLNRWDHPRPEVVARWQAAGARILRTDRDGAIRIAAGGIKTERARRWPFAWRLIPATDEPEG